MMAALFCLVGLALLLSVIVWHNQINQHPLFENSATGSATADLQIATVTTPSVSAVVAATPVIDQTKSTAVPDSVLKEITSDPRNLAGEQQPTGEMSPAVKFLYTLESPSIFPSQR